MQWLALGAWRLCSKMSLITKQQLTMLISLFNFVKICKLQGVLPCIRLVCERWFFFMFAVCFHCIQFICVWTILILSLIKFIFSQRDSVCGTARQLIALLFGSPRRNAYRFNYIKVLPGDGWQLFCYFFFLLKWDKKKTQTKLVSCAKDAREIKKKQSQNATANRLWCGKYTKMQLPTMTDYMNIQDAIFFSSHFSFVTSYGTEQKIKYAKITLVSLLTIIVLNIT